MLVHSEFSFRMGISLAPSSIRFTTYNRTQNLRTTYPLSEGCPWLTNQNSPQTIVVIRKWSCRPCTLMVVQKSCTLFEKPQKGVIVSNPLEEGASLCRLQPSSLLFLVFTRHITKKFWVMNSSSLDQPVTATHRFLNVICPKMVKPERHDSFLGHASLMHLNRAVPRSIIRGYVNMRM